MKFPGYISEAEARDEGFTHHGSYFGLPVWLGNVDTSFDVAAKVVWLDWLLPVISTIEGFLAGLFYPEAEPCFQFTIVKEINQSKDS